MAGRGVIPARRLSPSAGTANLAFSAVGASAADANSVGIAGVAFSAAGIGFSTGGGGGVGSTLVQVVLTNMSGTIATPAQSYVSFGQPFKAGAIPTGSRVRVELTDGTLVRSQADLRSTWSDSSLRLAEISCVVPSIAAGGTLTLNLKAEVGAYDNAAHRSVAEIVANSDIKVPISNLRTYLNVVQGSGNWTCSFNTARLTAANVEQVKSGPVCDQWRVWGFFTDNVGGAAHAHLNTIFYVTAWTKNDGTLGPISHINKVHQGWIGIAAPTMLWYDAVLKDGSTTIRDFKKQSAVGSVSATTDQVAIAAHTFKTMEPVLLTTTGTLPSGLALNTLYWVRYIDSGHFTLHSTCNGASTGSSGKANITDNGTGTHTVTRIIAHCYFGAWWTCDVDGLSDWTASEATVFVAHDKSYLISTRMLPPYYTDTVVSPTIDPTPTEYGPQRMGRMRVSINGTGGSEHIGILPQWCARALHAQNASYAQDARTNALIMSHINIQFRNEATGKIPALRGSVSLGASGDYAGLGTMKLTTQYYSTGTKSADFVAPTGGTEPIAWTTSEPSHHPQAIIYTAITEGGAHLIDAQFLHANYCLIWRGTGLQTGYGSYNRVQRVSSGRAYHYGLVIAYASNIRQDGWSLSCCSDAAAIGPDSWSETPYMKDVVSTNAAFAVEMMDNFDADFAANGWWLFIGRDQITQWQQHIVMNAVCRAAAVHGGANLARWVDHMKLMPIAFGEGVLFPTVAGAGSYKMLEKHSLAVSDTDYISSWADVGISNEGVSVVAATDVFTRPADSGEFVWVHANGDKVKWSYLNAGLTAQTLPTPLAYETWYYLVQVSGNTFKISATPGGVPIDITQDATNLEGFWRMANNPVSQRTIANDYISFAMAGLSWAMATGATGCATARANVKALNPDIWFTKLQAVEGNGGNTTQYSQPSWFLNSSYPA